MKRIFAILTLVPSICFGNLIDLTPGGFHEGDFPLSYVNFLNQVGHSNILFFDSIYASPTNGFPAGWVSQFGVLHGGDFISSDIDLTSPVPVTTLSWDFGDSGFFLTNVLVERGIAGGGDLAHLYGTYGSQRFSGDGTIILDGITDFNSIAFYGRNTSMPAPDSGWTIALFLIGIISLFSFYETKSRTPKA